MDVEQCVRIRERDAHYPIGPDILSSNVCFIKIRTTHKVLTAIVTLLWIFWQTLISYYNFLMQIPLK